jgi:hypothetical protein
MVISSCEDIHQSVPFVEHIMHGFILLRLRQKAAVGCHAVKLLLYNMHDWYCVLLSPFVVVAFRPAVFSNLMLVVLVVKENAKTVKVNNMPDGLDPTAIWYMMKHHCQYHQAERTVGRKLERFMTTFVLSQSKEESANFTIEDWSNLQDEA